MWDQQIYLILPAKERFTLRAFPPKGEETMRSLIGYLLGGLSSFENSLVDVLVGGFVHVRSFLTKGGETMQRLMKIDRDGSSRTPLLLTSL